MELQHHFTVPVPVDVAWSVLLDLERIAPCMPGAKLSKVEGNDFAGSVKVKLGPISLLYKGTGSFTEIDADAKRVVVDASGKDSKGNGTAAASVTAMLSAEGTGTKVTVDTDLKITGKPAQFGRGLISEVSGKLLTQFADCLAEQLSGGEQPAATSAAQAADTDGERASAEPSKAEPSTAEASKAGPSKAGPSKAEASKAGPTKAGPTKAGPTTAGPTTAGSSNGQAADTGPTTPQGNGAVPSAHDRQVEAIDLLGTAGTPMLKRIMPIMAALAFGAIVFSALRRRRRAR